MELIDRYVHEVGTHLPRKNRADIEAELCSLLVDNLEARVEGEPSEEDIVVLLQEFGPPDKVAASYSPGEQYLIGPHLFPLFRMVAGIVLIVLVSVQLVLLAVALLFNQDIPSLATWFADFFGGLFIAFGIVVLVFAVLQRLGVQPDEEEPWDPRTLPTDDEDDPISVRGLVVEIILSLILIGILLLVPDKIGAYLFPGGDFIPNPVLQSYLPLVIATITLGIVLDVVLIWRQQWTLLTRLAKILMNFLTIVVLFVLIDGHTTWLASANAAGFFSFLTTLPQGADLSPETVQLIVMQGFRLAFVVAMIIIIIETIQLLIRLVKQIFFTTEQPDIVALKKT
jgi:hypothetical protein